MRSKKGNEVGVAAFFDGQYDQKNKKTKEERKMQRTWFVPKDKRNMPAI